MDGGFLLVDPVVPLVSFAAMAQLLPVLPMTDSVVGSPQMVTVQHVLCVPPPEDGRDGHCRTAQLW